MNNLLCCPSSGRAYLVVAVSAALAVSLVYSAATSDATRDTAKAVTAALFGAIATALFLASLVTLVRNSWAPTDCAELKCSGAVGTSLLALLAVFGCSLALTLVATEDLAVVAGAVGLVYALCDTNTRLLDRLGA